MRGLFMRVLMLTWEYPPHGVGGLARHVEDLSESLVKENVETHVLTCKNDKYNTPEEEVHEGVHIYRVDPYPVNTPDFTTWILQLNLKMLEYAIGLNARQGPFQLVHAHDWLVAFAGRAIKHAYRIPFIATIHATEAGRNHGLHNDLQRYISSVEWWLGYEAWRVIVCSQHMKNEVKGVFQLPEDKVVIIPNGVDPKKYLTTEPDAGFRAQYARPHEKIIFFVGRLVREKGVQVLIDAAPQILTAYPQAKFVIAGKGPMESALRYQVQSRGLSHKVFFTGYIDDDTRNKLFRCAAIAVFPSLYEPFGIVALEAMAAQVPVVVGDTGGLAEIISHGMDGLKAFPGDAGSLASNIIQLLQNEKYADQLRRNANWLIAKVYDWRSIACCTKNVYQEVFQEYRYSPWKTSLNPFRRVLDFAVSRRFSRLERIPDAEVTAEKYTLIDRKAANIHFYEEGGEHH
jgi:glycogen(starch) synthase